MENYNHRIFSDFKHITFSYNYALIYPQGAGGNFISSRFAGAREVSSYNEFWADVGGNLASKIDTPDTLYTSDWDRLYNTLFELQPETYETSAEWFIGHCYPHVTSKIFDVEIKNVFEIKLSSDSLETYPQLIHIVKDSLQNKMIDGYFLYMMNSAMANSSRIQQFQALVPDALTGIHNAKKYNVDEEFYNRYAIKKFSGTLWHYILESHDNEKEISVVGLNDYIDDMIRRHCNTTTKEDTGRMKFCRANEEVINQYPAREIIYYNDLFIDLKCNIEPFLSIEKTGILEYSKDNLQLVTNFCKLYCDASNPVFDMLQEVADRLEEAELRNNLSS